MLEAPRKTSLGHVRVVKQLITVVLDLRGGELILRPFSLFNWIFP